jgi:hypothetical protein
MGTYRVLYWQEIPSQVVASDDDGDVRLPMPPRFLEHIDEAASARGLTGGDDYLAQWQWGDEEERAGTAQNIAEAVVAELEAKFDRPTGVGENRACQ